MLRKRLQAGFAVGCRAFAGAPSGFHVVLLGPPGGGKGTISKRLVRDYGFHHVSSGDILRANVSAGTSLGLKAKEFMSSGGLVPDALVTDLINAELEARSGCRLLLDGVPRTLEQAQALDGFASIDCALDLRVPFESVIARAAQRWVHAASGRAYAYDFNPPKVEGLDDETGEPLTQREDDKPEVVGKRLEVFQETAAPVRSFFDASGRLHAFSGDSCPELVAQDKRSDAIYAEVRPFMDARLGGP